VLETFLNYAQPVYVTTHFLEFAERENFAFLFVFFLFVFLTSGRSVSVLNLPKMAQPKNMRVEVSMPFEKLMEFMDYMDRISAHVETIEKDSETTRPVQECATGT
jgi:hypothetical protein